MPGYEVASRGHFFLLFVKLDHIAALRAAQRGNEPDLAECAIMCEKGGCDGVTVRLSRDMWYIQDTDVRTIKDAIRGKLNLEMALSDEIAKSAQEVNPYQITIVPDRREEVIAEDRLDVKSHMLKITDVVRLCHDHNVLVSLSIEPDLETVDLSKECGADFIEIHTEKYSNAVDKAEIDRELDRIYSAANHAVKIGIKVSAGHGLTYKNIMPVLYTRALEEVNIGYSIISRSLSVGLPKAVEEMLDILD
jgi:pyridoxine 5-phosphate synthase